MSARETRREPARQKTPVHGQEPQREVLCVGELLWDSLPAGLFLGGAPFNVACHLRVAGIPAAIVSRVGNDTLGHEAVRRAERQGVAVDLVQRDKKRPTGFVTATIDRSGNPSFEIMRDVAWDAIEVTDALLARAETASAIVFGTLAQRHEITRGTIQRLWKGSALMVCDVNLRPPFEDREVVRASLERADVVKLNVTEVERLAGWFGLGRTPREFAQTLSTEFACPTVVVTRGRGGAGMWRNNAWTEHPGFEAKVRDTIGAGDAFLAVLLAGLLAGRKSDEILRAANRAGADVSSRTGAV